MWFQDFMCLPGSEKMPSSVGGGVFYFCVFLKLLFIYISPNSVAVFALSWWWFIFIIFHLSSGLLKGVACGGGGPYCSRPFFPLMLAALVQTCPNDQIDYWLLYNLYTFHTCVCDMTCCSFISCIWGVRVRFIDSLGRHSKSNQKLPTTKWWCSRCHNWTAEFAWICMDLHIWQ